MAIKNSWRLVRCRPNVQRTNENENSIEKILTENIENFFFVKREKVRGKESDPDFSSKKKIFLVKRYFVASKVAGMLSGQFLVAMTSARKHFTRSFRIPSWPENI